MADWNPMVPQLLVSDLDASVAFYVDLLGFQVRFRRADPEFVYLSLGGAQLMLEAEHDGAWRTARLEKPRGRGVNLQIEVPDSCALRDRIVAAGRPLFRDLVETRYAVDSGTERQREVLVQDLDGYLLRFVEPLD